MVFNQFRNKGVTFIELLIALAIAVILVAFALPSMVDFTRNNRAVTQINDLQTALSLARSEAIKRNTQVVICKSGTGTACQDTGTAWHPGWIVFVDPDLDNQVDNVSEILLVNSLLQGENTLTFTPARVSYTSSGLAVAGANGAFTLCDSRGASYARGLIIGPSGRARQALDSNDNGIVEDASATDLTCGS